MFCDFNFKILKMNNSCCLCVIKKSKHLFVTLSSCGTRQEKCCLDMTSYGHTKEAVKLEVDLLVALAFMQNNFCCLCPFCKCGG
jgi:hypothetical protein